MLTAPLRPGLHPHRKCSVRVNSWWCLEYVWNFILHKIIKLHKYEFKNLKSLLFFCFRKVFPPCLLLCLSALPLWCNVILENCYFSFCFPDRKFFTKFDLTTKRCQNSPKLPSERRTWNTAQKLLITVRNLKRSSTQEMSWNCQHSRYSQSGAP